MRVILVMAGLVVSGPGAPARASGPVGLEAIEQFHRISELRQGVRAGHYSSHDPTGLNDDNNSYLAINGSEKVLLDVKGPGCIYRIWFTAVDFQATGILRIYFDNSPTPLVQMSLAEFFAGTHAPFLSPLVGNEQASSGGFYCYVPMPFREGCRITHTNTAALNYHNITFHRFPSDEGITTFTGQESTAAACAIWNATGTDPKPDPGSTILTGTIAVAAASTATLADVHSAGTIQRLELNIPGMSESLLAALRVRAYWDGAAQPAVDAPAGLFFGSGLGPATVAGLPIGMSGSRLYCYFPMPFRSAALVQLVNTSGTAINNVTFTVRYTSLAEPPEGVGQFHTQHRREAHPTGGRDYLILDETGAGHLVGLAQTFRGYTTNQGYMEGDERIHVDGTGTPTVYGTGVEDFYNGGWYFWFGTFSRPVHGNPVEFDQGTARHTCYRFFLSDTIPFTTGIRFGMEHGGWNEFDADIETVAFYYQALQPLAALRDELDVGETASEAAHGYQATGVTWTGSSQLAYEGDDDPVLLSDTGRRLGLGGGSTFTVAVYPRANVGVLLRRRLDYRIPRQQARVWVDGDLAGTWYDPGSNSFFADSEFQIAPALTQGKAQFTIHIENASNESDWSEYRYWAYALLPIVPAIDSDGDGVFDGLDNCPTAANPDQADADRDGLGDVCDDDADDDAVLNPVDNCWLLANLDQLDADDDGYGDACDACPHTIPGVPVDTQGCSTLAPGDFDVDGDVDQQDFGHLQRCLTGPGQEITETGCLDGDLDGDHDADGYDVARFERCLSGANLLADPECTETLIDDMAPDRAFAPQPADQAAYVSVRTTLSWQAGSGATSHDVYFGATEPPGFRGNQTLTAFAPGSLARGARYYWRIDEVNALGTTAGELWTFATVPPDPVQNLNRYELAHLSPGQTYYRDRTYVIIAMPPALDGELGIKTDNNDKNMTAASWITFDLLAACDVYIVYDRRATTLPAWMSSYADTGLTVGVSDTGAGPMKVYKRTFPAGPVVLGGNKQPPAAGADSNYWVVIVPVE